MWHIHEWNKIFTERKKKNGRTIPLGTDCDKERFLSWILPLSWERIKKVSVWENVLKRTGRRVHWTEYVHVQFVHILASYNLKYYTEFIFCKVWLSEILKTDVTDFVLLRTSKKHMTQIALWCKNWISYFTTTVCKC